MKTQRTSCGKYQNGSFSLGFSLVEVMVGVAILGIFFITFFAMLGNGLNMVKVSRENLRATQIILNRLEGVRLYTWEKLVYSNAVPANFTEYYNPNVTNGLGATYAGTVSITTPAMNPSAAYSADKLKQVTVQVSWTSAGKNRSRSMSTYVSQFGMQNYIFTDAN